MNRFIYERIYRGKESKASCMTSVLHDLSMLHCFINVLSGFVFHDIKKRLGNNIETWSRYVRNITRFLRLQVGRPVGYPARYAAWYLASGFPEGSPTSCWILARYWRGIKQIFAKYWPDIGEILAGPWLDIGQALARYCSDIGWTLARDWPDIGQILASYG